MKLSVKKFSKKSLSLLIALIMIISALPFTPPISADAATQDVTKTVTVSDYGVISNSGRIGNGYFEIVNDGKNGNFSIGVLKFDLSNINKTTDVIKSAQYTLQHACIPSNNNRTDGMQLGFYYPTKNNNTYTLNNNWTATTSGDAKNNIISSTTDSKFSHFGTAVNYFGLKEITRVTSKADSVTYSLTLELADMMNYFLQQGEKKATLMILLIGNDATIDASPWSDRKVTPSTSSFNVTCMQTTAYSGTTEIDKTAYNNAISAFTSKMNDSNVYYNMKAAYDAYIALKQSYDLFYYGGSTTITADTVNNNIDKLFKAVNNMKVWSSYNSFFDPNEPSQLFAGDSASGIYGTAYKDYYKNTLYVAGSVNDINSSKTDYMTIMWNMPYAVGLYTGSPIEVPVMTGIKADTGQYWGLPNGYMYTNYLVNNYSNQINYRDNWYYRSGTGSKHLSYSTIQPSGIAVSKTKANTNGYNYSCSYGNNPRWAYNAITINPTGFSNNYQEFTTLDLYCRASRTSGLATSETRGNLISVPGAQIGYYVIDYRPVPNNLTTAKTKIKAGIANFDSDNVDMSSLMSSVDKMTNLNNTIANTFPSTASGVSQATCQSNAKTIANNITSYVSEFTTNNNNTAADASKTTAYNNLRSAMDSTMTDYKKGAEELKKTYTASSVDAFITAYNNAKSIMGNVFAENYGNNATDTNTKASELRTAYSNLALKKATVTFTSPDPNDLLAPDIEIGKVEVEPGKTASESDMPALSSPVYDATGLAGENKHWEYFWQNTSDSTRFTSSTVVNSDITVTEKRERVSCTIVNKGIQGDNDNINLECSVCKHTSTLNASAYNAAVADAQTSIANSQVYSEASRNALSNILSEQATAISKATTQDEVNNCTSAIISANQIKTVNESGLEVGTLVLNQYSITVKYVDENSELGTDTITNVDYGTIKDVTAKTNFDNKDYVVYKWTRSTKDGDKLLGLNSTSVSVNVIGNLTYYVHLKSTQAESSTNTAVVTLNNKAGKPVDVGYVTTNEAQDVVVNGNTIQIGTNTTLTAPQYSFYDIKGFIVNGELITADSGTKSITVTENMSIIPLYSATPFVNITRNSVETFTINGKDIDSYLAKWDELITLESTGDVIWYTKIGEGESGVEVVLGQGASLKFRANEDIEIYTKPIGETLSPISRVGYFGYDADLKKVTIVNNFFVPGGANENVKAGVVVSTKEKTRDELITQCEAGSLKFEGGYDKFTADKNQLRISINRSGSGDFSMWALSYVVVGNTTYYASEVSTYTYNSSATA